MSIGQLVAKRWKRQYCKGKIWEKHHWEIQPEQIHTILLELISKEACIALVGMSWVRYLRRDP